MQELWDHKLTYGKNVLNLIDTFLDYPNHETQAPVVASYCCLPSRLIKFAPILALVGESRSGKSTTGKLIGKLQNMPLFGNSSIAGAKRYINALEKQVTVGRQLYINPDTTESYEAQKMLILEDISGEIIQQPHLYQILKTSRDRSTSVTIQSSSQFEDGISKFDCFCLCVISTVCRIWEVSQFEELANRTIFIDCKRTDKDVDQLEDYDDSDLLQYWLQCWDEQEPNWKPTWQQTKRKPTGFSLPMWQISRPCIVAGYLCGVFGSLETAIETFRDYWLLQSDKQIVDWYEIGCKAHIEKIKPIHDEVVRLQRNNDIEAQEFEVKAGVLSEFFKTEKGSSLMLNRVENSEIHKAMIRLGYALVGDSYKPKTDLSNNEEVES